MGCRMSLPDCTICRRQICADHRWCEGELFALLERLANPPERTLRERAVELWGDVSLTLTPEQWKARAA
jgi:hypothetical protein